jgi:hypothetical protein
MLITPIKNYSNYIQFVWLIDKPSLDYKFDSLKTTITSPLKPLGFYKKLSPLVAAVRQGHLFMLLESN